MTQRYRVETSHSAIYGTTSVWTPVSHVPGVEGWRPTFATRAEAEAAMAALLRDEDMAEFLDASNVRVRGVS